jgi:hypothetical protein
VVALWLVGLGESPLLNGKLLRQLVAAGGVANIAWTLEHHGAG